MGTPHIQVPIDALNDVGEVLIELKEAAAKVALVDVISTTLVGVDWISGGVIRDAAARFQHEWSPSLQTLLDNLELIGQVSKQIAEAVRELDAVKASGMKTFAHAISFDGAGGGMVCLPCDNSSVYAFNEQVASQSEALILATMGDMKDAVNQTMRSVFELKPHWVGVEADQYYSYMDSFTKGISAIIDILSSIEEALGSVREDTSVLRTSIRDVLNNSE